MTTKADTSVKWFHSDMLDAPTLRGEAGALIELLDACLINGFSTRTPDSIVVADEVATVTISAGNPYEKHAVIAITGASVAALNAEWRIATSAATSFTFACPGVADGTATGATVKRAGAGWEKPFAGTNVAVYQSTDPESTQLYIRVGDADARYTRVRGYEQMTSVDTGAGLFPTQEGIPLDSWTWPKSLNADSTPRDWVLVADSCFFYWLPIWASSSYTPTNYSAVASILYFGDLDKLSPSDKYNCVITAHRATTLSSVTESYNGGGRGGSLTGSNFTHLARPLTQTGAPIFTVYVATGVNGFWSPPTGSVVSQPTVDGRRMFTAPCFMLEGTSISGAERVLRGSLPGSVSALFSEWGSVATKPHETLDDGEGFVVILVRAAVQERESAMSPSASQVGAIPISIIGPWR